MADPILITCAQLNPTVGDLAGNRKKIESVWATHDQSDLIIFPELFLTGYPPEDLVLNAAFLHENQTHFEALLDFSKTSESAP